jgi:hypothetical protein
MVSLFCRVAPRRSRWPGDKTSECRQSVSNCYRHFVCDIFPWFLYISKKVFRIRKTSFEVFRFFYDEIYILLPRLEGDLEHITVSVSRNHRKRRNIGVLFASLLYKYPISFSECVCTLNKKTSAIFWKIQTITFYRFLCSLGIIFIFLFPGIILRDLSLNVVWPQISSSASYVVFQMQYLLKYWTVLREHVTWYKS